MRTVKTLMTFYSNDNENMDEKATFHLVHNVPGGAPEEGEILHDIGLEHIESKSAGLGMPGLEMTWLVTGYYITE
jgi:hypothetical protein